MTSPAQEARAGFATAFSGAQPVGVAVAPGRVNLIGEHTDYNDGYVLPMAVDSYVAAAFAPNPSGVLRGYSTKYPDTLEVPLDRVADGRTGSWFDYVAGVVWSFADAGLPVTGMDIAIASDLPTSSGLSSSAALELAAARTIVALTGSRWDPVEAARLCQRAENEYVGVKCGIMDQLVIASAREGCALLIDCRDLSVEPTPMPPAIRVVVMDTGAPRELAESGYNERRASCEAAVGVIRESYPEVGSLRDVDGAKLAAVGEQLDPVTYKRAQHVIAETARPRDMAEALSDGDLARCGALMADSHWSLRDLYEVSCTELDLMTRLAASHPGCYGARLTGAGFGGCAVALVDAAQAEAFVGAVAPEYERQTGRPSGLRVCRPVAGVSVI